MRIKKVVIDAIKAQYPNEDVPTSLLNGLSDLVLKTYFPCTSQLHLTHEGYISHTREFIRSLIGQYYKGAKTSSPLNAINKTIPIFEIAGEYTKKETTKGYKLLPWIEEGITAWLYNEYIAKPLEESDTLQNKGKAIMTEDANGKRRKTKGNIRFGVRVNRAALQEAYAKLETEQERKQVLYLLDLSNGETLPHGWVPQIYQESAAGRLYGQGLNMQNIKKTVRNIALMGTYQYDMSNAHYTILHQHCRKHGVELKGIDHYLANKKDVRATLASDTDLPMSDVKTALISLIYGASIHIKENKKGKKYAIRNICKSDEQFGTLVNHPLFKSIAKDIDRGASLLIKTSKSKGGNYFNALGKPISCKEPREKILAHFLQGVEAKALDAIISDRGHNIALLLHDGISFYSKQDVVELEKIVLDATGYVIKFEFEYNPAMEIIKRDNVEGIEPLLVDESGPFEIDKTAHIDCKNDTTSKVHINA